MYIGDTKCRKCYNFLSRFIAELTGSFNAVLLTDDHQDANGNEGDTLQDLLPGGEIGHDDDDEILIGHTQTPIINNF